MLICFLVHNLETLHRKLIVNLKQNLVSNVIHFWKWSFGNIMYFLVVLRKAPQQLESMLLMTDT